MGIGGSEHLRVMRRRVVPLEDERLVVEPRIHQHDLAERLPADADLGEANLERLEVVAELLSRRDLVAALHASASIVPCSATGPSPASER